MNIIIPLGGKGERFLKNGYTEPKHLIKIFNKTMIEHVINNLQITENDKVFIIYRPLCECHFASLFQANFPQVHLIELTTETKGAAETLLIGLDYIFTHYTYNEKCLIVDCDTFYTENIIEMFSNTKHNTVFYTESFTENPIYSYIELDETSTIINITEKRKISNNANTGAYGFTEIKILYEYCKFVVDNNITFNNEPYTSCVIGEMLKNNIEFKGKQLHKECVFSLGTPDELNAYINKTSAFMFDLDGTLVLTDDIYFSVWYKILFDYNIVLTPEIFKTFIQGNTDLYVINNFHLYINLKDLSKFKDDEFIKHIDKIKVIDGVYEVLKKIKRAGHRCCIVTNCNYDVAYKIISICGFDKYIDFFISSNDCKNGKPHPEPYLKAIEKYNISNTKCFIFEDSKTGLLSAKSVYPKQLIGITTNYNETELMNIGTDIFLKDYAAIDTLELFTNCNSMNVNKMTKMIKTNTALDIENVIIDDTKLKGGFIADVIKICIETKDSSIHDCVLKYENTNQTNLSHMAKQLQLYDREYYFYTDIYPYINIKVPKFISLLKDDDFNNHGIILEDLFKHKNLTINMDLNVETIDISLKIINRFAYMHSKFWNKNLQKMFPQLKKNNDAIFCPFLKRFLSDKIELFKQRWKNVLTPGNLQICDEIFENFDSIQQRLSSGHLTFIHGDIKSPNIFYDKVNDEPYFIDWQHCCIGKGVQDLIFFVIESFELQHITTLFPLFKTYYYKILLENGVSNYSFREYEQDIDDALRYIPFFTAVWFGTVPTEDLIDKNWPFFFIQKTFSFY